MAVITITSWCASCDENSRS